MDLRCRSETHEVDLIMQSSLWRAVPDSSRTQSLHEQGFPLIPPGGVDLARGEVVGLASLPNHVVALTAVPGSGARPFSTSPSLPGSYATGCGPVSPVAG
jgi:hypothetical protein